MESGGFAETAIGRSYTRGVRKIPKNGMPLCADIVLPRNIEKQKGDGTIPKKAKRFLRDTVPAKKLRTARKYTRKVLKYWPIEKLTRHLRDGKSARKK